jgi:hypothetical protein
MSIRRLFWLGAAVLFSIAALVAIAAVLGSGFGETQGRILATCGIAFVCGAATLAGLACIDRGVIRPVAWVAVLLGIASFAVWTGAAWQEDAGVTYWKLAGVLGVWVLAALVVTTLRLLASSPRLLRTVVPATWATAVLAAAVSTQMILGEDESPWKLVVVLVILTALGYALTPILQRFWAAADAPPPAERLLGTVADVEVVAVPGDAHSVQIGERAVRLNSGEKIVLRLRTR